MKPHARHAPAARVRSAEALGQLGGSERLEDDIGLCPLQTIEPHFRKYLPRQEPILEAGSGRGRWIFHLERLGYRVVGVDLAMSDIAFAKRHDPRVPIVLANVLRTPFSDQSFGAIVSLGVVEHFEEGPHQAFAEVLRLLRPGGLFLVTVPTQNPLRSLLVNPAKNLLTWYRRRRGVALAFEEYRYSRPQFEALLRQAGFQIVERAPDDFLPPKNMGLYTDVRWFQHPSARWELNRAGNVVAGVLRALSPWLSCSGTLWVCRKPA
jgi:SAM-dependent methyltransferase